ncbi:MAG: phospholipid carrier-dependent glycosyltransferase [Candidatus Moranbacteria bacterium]|nr:phospholipid carrier-dependent glycosyltransferase [Candidatus Moranbacteria bacterium]
MLGFLNRYFFHISLALVFSAYFFFGLQHLGKFITADEHYWVYERVPQYWDAVANSKWKKTFINDKPGVSLALVSGIGYFLDPDSKTLCVESNAKILTCQTNRVEAIYRDFRLPLLILNGCLLFLLFFLIVKLTNPWIALWTTLLSALSPILLGISQIVNPDSLLWSFGMVAIFSFFALLKSEEKKFLWLTVVCTGLALLSKYTALILFPFFLALILFRFLRADETTDETLRSALKKSLIQWTIIVFGALILLCLFLPALLISPSARDAFFLALPHKLIFFSSGGLLLGVLALDTFIFKNKFLFFVRTLYRKFLVPLSRALPFLFLGIFFFLIIARNFFAGWRIFALIPFDIKDLSNARYYTDTPRFLEALLLEWNPIIFSLTPLVLLGLTALLTTLIVKKKNNYSFFSSGLLLFALAYTLLLLFSNVLSTPRYSVFLYPLFAFLAALGFWFICEKFTPRWTPFFITSIIFLGSLASLITIKPFYFNYTNFLLPQNALISDAWGYGGYEAAVYLNGLPNAERLTVWSDYYGVCEFFVGRCLTAYSFDKETLHPDYYVLTRRGQIRYMPKYDRWEEKSGLTAYRYYNAPNPAWQLFIGNRQGNFIKVVKVNPAP